MKLDISRHVTELDDGRIQVRVSITVGETTSHTCGSGATEDQADAMVENSIRQSARVVERYAVAIRESSGRFDWDKAIQ